jgi:hypothetical protein
VVNVKITLYAPILINTEFKTCFVDNPSNGQSQHEKEPIRWWRVQMNVWNGNTAVLLTSWAKTTASAKGSLRKQVEEVARAAGFGLGNYTTRHTYPQ